MRIITAALAPLLALSACGEGAPRQAAPLTGTSQSPIGPDAAQAIEGPTPPPAFKRQAGHPDVNDAVLRVQVPTDAWVGRWTGPEGLVLDIALKDGRSTGNYRVTETLLDGTERYDGMAHGATIVFMRAGKQEVIRSATGAETGLKWLAGKSNCLVINPGEGFCRDAGAGGQAAARPAD